MGTPWPDQPPLVYLAEPIDKASGQNFAVASTMVSTLSTWGCNIYRPSRAFTATRIDPRIEAINRNALYQSDAIVAYLSETTPSIGVPAEIEAATSRGIPAVVHYTGESFVLASNPLVTVIDDTSSIIQAVEHALKNRPAADPAVRLLDDMGVDPGMQKWVIPGIVHPNPSTVEHIRLNGWCAQCGGTGDPKYTHLDTTTYLTNPHTTRLAHEIDDLQALQNRINATVLAERAAYPIRFIAGSDDEPLRLVIAEGSTPPGRAYPDDAGIDLTTAVEHTIDPGEYVDIKTQVLATQLPVGYWAQIIGRSSALRKWRLHIPQAVIDPGWRGPLFVGVWNLGHNPVTVRPGDRLGQLILIPNHTPPVEIVDTVNDHPRGLNGFGSSG